MKLLIKLINLSFKQQLMYRMALWAGLATNLFFGLLRAVLLIALYGESSQVNGLTLNNAVTYVGITQAMIAFLTIFGSMDIMNTIYTGAIGSDLLRPISYYWFWLGKDLGKSLVNLFGRGVLFLLFYHFFFPVQLPAGVEQWGWLLVSLSLAWLVSFSFRFLISLAAFWTPDARGFLRIGFTLAQFLSGFMMPLRLLPDWFSSLVSFTPFPSMVDTSVQVFLGTLGESDLVRALGVQLVWFVLLAGLAQFVLRAGVHRLVVQGG